MGQYSIGIVRIDVPPLPNTKFLAANIGTTAPANNRLVAMAEVDDHGIVSITHNSSTAAQGFTPYIWSDVCQYWIPLAATGTIVQFGQAILCKACPGTLLFFAASAGMSGGSIAVIGGATTQGSNYTKSA